MALPYFSFDGRLLPHHLLLSVSFTLFVFLVLLSLFLQRRRRRPVLLLGYSCHLPDPSRRCSLEVCEFFGLRSRRFSPSSCDFMRFIFRKSGLGDETYAPPFIFQGDIDAKLRHAVQEAEEGLCTSVAALLAKCDLRPADLTHVLVACSMYSPAPSLASLLVHHFKLPSTVKTYSFAGMGCSAGTVLTDAAARMLRNLRHPGYALVVVTESTSLNWYFGDNKHMLVTNCIFRAGTAALLLTDDPARRPTARFELARTLRTHHGADDAAYNAALQMEDEDGNVGVALSRDLVRVAGAALRRHITELAPSVLPISEMLRYVYKVVCSYVAGNGKMAAATVPDFKMAFEHMCIHAGGKAVIDAVGKLMKFEEVVVEPARMTLHRFGNTSSSLVFYELAYFDAKRRIKAGDRLWMLAFGTGFKACSVVWTALRDSVVDSDNPWKGCIHRYPVYQAQSQVFPK